jgi:lipopolysaccharide/colanic/teichoic acid biosynthesis glycosyltransferase
VKPGITGWAQVRFGYASTIEDAENKLQFDLYYIKNMSLLFDLTVVLQTLKVMVLGKGAR